MRLYIVVVCRIKLMVYDIYCIKVNTLKARLNGRHFETTVSNHFLQLKSLHFDPNFNKLVHKDPVVNKLSLVWNGACETTSKCFSQWWHNSTTHICVTRLTHWNGEVVTLETLKAVKATAFYRTILPFHYMWPKSNLGVVMMAFPPRGAFYRCGLTLIIAWTSYCIHYKVWDEISYTPQNFNGTTVEV